MRSPPTRAARPSQQTAANPSLLVGLLIAGILTALWILYGLLTVSEHDDALAESRREVTSLAHAYAEYSLALADVSIDPTQEYRRVHAEFDRERLATFSSTLQPSPGITIRIVSATDGSSIAAAPADAPSERPVSAEAREHYDGETDEWLRLRIDVPAGGVVILAELRKAEALAEWRHGADVEGAGLAVLTALATILAFVIVRQLRRREAIEGDLRQAEARLTHAQEIARLGSWELDLSNNEMDWSTGMDRILGLAPDHPSPTRDSLTAHLSEPDRRRFEAWLTGLAAGEEPPRIEVALRRDGSSAIMVCEAQLVPGDHGAPGKLVGVMLDVSEAKELERQRRDLEAQIHHSQKLEALGTLAGGVAHDLNNTLVPMLALSKMLLRKFSADAATAENLEAIHQAAVRARDLVRQILDFSRRRPVDHQVVDLAPLLTEVLGMLHATVPATIRIDARIDGPAPVLGDATQFYQIVVNLVTNATHAIGAQVGTITVSLGREPGLAPSQSYHRLTVADTGCGMDEATRRRMFEPFFTTREVGQGTGLGLSVVHGIVTSLGGTIDATSEVGHGTEIVITLPAYVAPEPSA